MHNSARNPVCYTHHEVVCEKELGELAHGEEKMVDSNFEPPLF
jgi:hypothetical protein